MIGNRAARSCIEPGMTHRSEPALAIVALSLACHSAPRDADSPTTGDTEPAESSDTGASPTTDGPEATGQVDTSEGDTSEGDTSDGGSSDTGTVEGPIDFAFSWTLDDDPNAYAELSRIAVTPDGGVVLAGAAGSWADGRHLMFLSFEADGTPGWAFSWEMAAGSHEIVSDLAVAPDGTIYAVGFTDAGGYGSNDALVMAIDPDGTVAWSRAWGGENSDVANGVVVDAEGRAIVVGWSDPDADACDDDQPECRRNGMVLTLSATGEIERTVSWVEGTRTDAQAVAIDADGDLWVTGLLSVYGGQNAGGLWRIDEDGVVTTEHGWSWSQRDAAPSEVFLGPDGDAFVVDHPHTFDGGDDPVNLVIVHVGEALWTTDHAIAGDSLAGGALGIADGQLVALGSTGAGPAIVGMDPASGAVVGPARRVAGLYRAGMMRGDGRAMVVTRGDAAAWEDVDVQSVVTEVEPVAAFEPPTVSALVRGTAMVDGVRGDVADTVVAGEGTRVRSG